MNETKNESVQTGFIILNPVAGDGNPEQIQDILLSSLDEEFYDIYETTGEESLPEVVQTAVSKKNYAWVAAIGGDGTVSEVANGLLGTDVPLAIIPAGTGNGLAKALDIPQETEAACELLQDAHQIRHIDGMQLGEQTYFLHMGAGLESKTMQGTSAEQKNRWGPLAYMWTAVKEAFGWQPHHFTLTLDGQSRHIQASELILANAGEVGVLGLEWEDSIVPDDGRVDVVVVRARSLIDYARLIWSLVRGQQKRADHIQFFHAHDEIKIEMERPLPLHGDGEMLEQTMPVTAVIKPGVLPIIVPLETHIEKGRKDTT